MKAFFSLGCVCSQLHPILCKNSYELSAKLRVKDFLACRLKYLTGMAEEKAHENLWNCDIQIFLFLSRGTEVV